VERARGVSRRARGARRRVAVAHGGARDV
jgi:hypothetical protein